MAITASTNSFHTITLIEATGNVTIDWGDGTVDVIAAPVVNAYHRYDRAGNYTTTITGTSITKIDWSNDIALRALDVDEPTIVEIHAHNMRALGTFTTHDWPALTHLCLPNCKVLAVVDTKATWVNLECLDMGYSTALRELEVRPQWTLLDKCVLSGCALYSQETANNLILDTLAPTTRADSGRDTHPYSREDEDIFELRSNAGLYGTDESENLDTNLHGEITISVTCEGNQDGAEYFRIWDPSADPNTDTPAMELSGLPAGPNTVTFTRSPGQQIYVEYKCGGSLGNQEKYITSVVNDLSNL